MFQLLMEKLERENKKGKPLSGLKYWWDSYGERGDIDQSTTFSLDPETSANTNRKLESDCRPFL